MRIITCTLLALTLAACAKKDDAPAELSPNQCAEYPSSYAVQWPNGQVVKSTIAACPGDSYYVQSMDGQGYFSDQPVLRVDTGGGVYAYVDFGPAYVKPD
jgi:hypothetical protein